MNSQTNTQQYYQPQPYVQPQYMQQPMQPMYTYAPMAYPTMSPQLPLAAPLVKAKPVAKKALNNGLKFGVRSDSEKRHFVVSNATTPYAVKLRSSDKFVRNLPNKNGELSFTFEPTGKSFEGDVYDNSVHVLSFVLKPKSHVVVHDKENGITIKNVYNKNNIKAETNIPLVHELVKSEKEPHTYSFKYEPAKEVVDLKLLSTRNGKQVPIKKGSMKLAACPQPEQNQDNQVVEIDEQMKRLTVKPQDETVDKADQQISMLASEKPITQNPMHFMPQSYHPPTGQYQPVQYYAPPMQYYAPPMQYYAPPMYSNASPTLPR